MIRKLTLGSISKSIVRKSRSSLKILLISVKSSKESLNLSKEVKETNKI
jgi:hypothetical protein